MGTNNSTGGGVDRGGANDLDNARLVKLAPG